MWRGGINMFSGRLLPCLMLLLCYVPGAQCSYKYNVGGMVASSVAAFFLLGLIIVMLVIIVMWRDWYERRQLLKGRPKRPRRYWGLFQGRKKGQASLISTPRSDRKLHSAGRNHVVYGSRNTTLTRADDWMNKAEFANQNSKYEEKVQTITLEPEEEAVIVADILPENDTRTRPTIVANHDPAPTRKVDYDPGVDYRHDENTHYVAYNAPKSNYESRQQLRATMPATYHVKLSHLDEPPLSNDLFIAPPIPTTTITETTPTVITSTVQISDETPGPSGIGNDGPQAVVNEDPLQPAIMTFHDSEEEAGIIPNIQAQGEQNVLF